MIDRDVSPTSGDDQQQARIYRRVATTTSHIGRFVSTLLREILEPEGLRYDAVYTAFAESGIQPMPSAECKSIHFDTRIDRQNAFADALFEGMAIDEKIRAAITSLATALFNRLTLPAPGNHLSESELEEFLACCVATSDSSADHIGDYERYAAFHAHVGTCALCDQSLLARYPAATRPAMTSDHTASTQ